MAAIKTVFYFEEKNLPPLNKVAERMKVRTGLDLNIEFVTGNGNEGFILWFDDNSTGDAITVDFVADDLEIVTIRQNLKIGYLTGHLFATLIELGGRTDSTIKLPDWVNMKWEDKKWWQRIPFH